MSSVRVAVCLGVLCAVLVGSSPAAFALEDLAPALPQDTVLYARVAGIKPLLSELESSRMLKDGAFLAQLYRENMAQYFPMLKELTQVPVEVWKKHIDGVTGIHFARFGFSRKMEDFDAIGIVEIADEDGLRELIAKTPLGPMSTFAGEIGGAKVMVVEQDDVQIYYAIHGKKMFVTNRPERISTVLEGLAKAPDKNLASLPAYRAGALRADKSTTLFGYCDMGKFFHLLESTMGRFELRFYTQADEIVKFDGLKTACVVSGGGTTRARAVVDPNHPWLAAFRGEAGPVGMTSFLPADTFFTMVDSGSLQQKWKQLRKTLTSDEFPFANEMKEGLKEAEKMLGVSIDEIIDTMGSEWVMLFPLLGGSLSQAEDNATFGFEIKDREKFDQIMKQFFESPLMKQIQESGFAMSREKYGGQEIIRMNREGSSESPSMVIFEDRLFFAGNVKALKAVIDSKSKGGGFLSSAGPFMEGLPSSSSKFAAMSLRVILMMESEFTPLLDLVKPGAVIAATADESPERVDFIANESLPNFVGILVAGELLMQRHKADREACISNLNAVGQAIKKYREKNNRDPEHLLELVPEYLPKERLICPFDKGKEDHRCSYEEAIGTGGSDNSWLIDAWCPHRLHGRVALQRSGRAWRTSESSFERRMVQQGIKIE
jgi:hypothetical protein